MVILQITCLTGKKFNKNTYCSPLTIIIICRKYWHRQICSPLFDSCRFPRILSFFFFQTRCRSLSTFHFRNFSSLFKLYVVLGMLYRSCTTAVAWFKLCCFNSLSLVYLLSFVKILSLFPSLTLEWLAFSMTHLPFARDFVVLLILWFS